MKQFKIDDSERERIINLHESATKRQYLNEQSSEGIDFKDIEGSEKYGEDARFKVTFGGENAIFNGKEGYNGAIITPMTTIQIEFGQGGVILSGMGTEIKLDSDQDGSIEIIKDVA